MAKGKKAGARKRPAKLKNVLSTVRKCVAEGRYLDTRHATDRQSERLVTRLEVLQVIQRGHHVPSRDRYEEGYGEQGWSYAIEGNTVDNRLLRVIVAFDEQTRTLIVTAVDLAAS